MEIKRKNILVFGYGLGLILSVMALRLYHHGHSLWIIGILALGAMTVTLLTAVNYLWIIPFYKSWLKVTRVIGTIIFGTLLTVIYYLVFASAGLVMRLMGKDILHRRIDDSAKSYWIPLPQEQKEKASYLKQY